MARLRLRQIPTRSFKKRGVPPAFRFKNSPRMVANVSAGLNSIGPDRNKARTTLRKILMQDLATSIVNDTRVIHMNETMAGWRELRGMGQLDGEVAIIVDGSPSRPIKNVQFAGRIDIVAPASVELLTEAAAFAWYTLHKQASKFSPSTASQTRKGHAYRYIGSFEMFISDKRQVKTANELAGQGGIEPDDWVTIHNHVPYAARIEREKYPAGPFWHTYKALRRKYGARLAIRFDFVASTDGIIKTSSGKGGQSIPIAQPVLRIGQPGAFPNRAPKMKKIIRDAGNRKWK